LLVGRLRELGIFTLNCINIPTLSYVWKQNYLFVQELGLENNWSEYWLQFRDFLRTTNVHLSEEEDDLVWIFLDLGGKYSTKLGYKYLFQGDGNDTCW
jgi:hypothetical protein